MEKVDSAFPLYELTEIGCIYGSEECLMADLYRCVGAISAIKHAPTIDTLKDAFRTSARTAKSTGDIDLLQWLTEVKDKRKKELEKI